MVTAAMKLKDAWSLEQKISSKKGKEYVKVVYCHPVYLIYMQSTSCEMLGWMNHKLESRLLGEISISSDMQMTPPHGRKWRGAKKPLDESERGEWKSWLKTQIRKTKIMASGPITSWQIDGETMETVRDFILGDSKITADGDCSHEIKRCLFLERKVMTNLLKIKKHIKKQRHYVANKDPSSQSYCFSSSHLWM